MGDEITELSSDSTRQEDAPVYLIDINREERKDGTRQDTTSAR